MKPIGIDSLGNLPARAVTRLRELFVQAATPGVKLWVGTRAELPATRDSKTFYAITDAAE